MKYVQLLLSLCFGAFLSGAFLSCTATAATLDAVKARGYVLCGVSHGLPGFSKRDAKGRWRGFDVDFCRAVAAAIFDNPGKVRFIPLSAAKRFTALKSGRIDLLSRNTTWTMERDTELGLSFAAVAFYDRQVFMVKKSLGVSSAFELSGMKICAKSGTTTLMNANDYFLANKLAYKIVQFEAADKVLQAYDNGRCQVITADLSGLAAQRASLANPDDHVVLPEIISREPLGPVIRQDDYQWFNLVKWTMFALINAEAFGVGQDNLEQKKMSRNPAIRRLLGMDGKFGAKIGVDNDWVANIIKHVGNYGEIYDRNLGPDTIPNIPRGMNRLWKHGGILYAPPIR